MPVGHLHVLFGKSSIQVFCLFSTLGIKFRLTEMHSQHFGHLMGRADSLEKTLMLGKTEGRRRSGWWRIRWLDSITESMDVNMSRLGDDRGWDGWMASPTQWPWAWAISKSWWWTGGPGMLQSMGLQRAGHDWVTEQQHNKGFILHLPTSDLWSTESCLTRQLQTCRVLSPVSRGFLQ